VFAIPAARPHSAALRAAQAVRAKRWLIDPRGVLID
jgi:hypothetical protein